MKGRRAGARPKLLGRAVTRAGALGASTALALTLIAPPVFAQDSTAPLNAVSSTGGVATAEGSSSVQTGDVITGQNIGHSVDTGGTSNGDLIVSVAEMSSESDLDFVAEVGPQIADASGGDEGDASTSPGDEPPNFNVNIRNKDVNNNSSNATGIGEGGEGGEGGAGGDGGDATINNGVP